MTSLRRVRQRETQQGRLLFRRYGLLATLFLAFVWNTLRNPPVVFMSENGSLRDIHNSTTTNSSSDDIKYILYYTPFWNAPDYTFGFGQEPFQACPNPRCFATNNRTYLQSMGDFHAILFHSVDFNIQLNLAAILKWRKRHQRFVYVNLESPQTYPLPSYPSHFYNWTMTYRHDSDIPCPYGWIRPKEEEAMTIYPPPPRESWPIVYNDQESMQDINPLAKRVPGKVAWIVSKCDTPSRRMEYALELAKHIPVDIFGACLGKPCNAGYGMNILDNCTLAVKENYKFYLAFENTFCNDYITEKFFGHINESLVVVMGQADYRKVAPPHSYVNVMDFEGPKELAAYLWELDRNDTLYLSYFWWKQHYTVRSIFKEFVAQGMCKLCEKLHNYSEPYKTYPDLQEWWTTKAECGRLQALNTTSHLRINWKNG